MKNNFYLKTMTDKELIICMMEESIDALKTNIEQIPAADVVEVVHGEWKDLSSAGWQCSECNYKVERWNNTPYCPNCGTKMDGDING